MNKSRYDLIQDLNNFARNYYNGKEKIETVIEAARMVIEFDFQDCSEVQEPYITLTWTIEEGVLYDLELTIWDGDGDNDTTINTNDLYTKIEQSVDDWRRVGDEYQSTLECLRDER